jgi:non-lysosomal glucosylceramidase
MKAIARALLFFGLPGLFLSTDRIAADWTLPAKYNMSFPYLKAYRYGPMLGGIGTGGFSFNTMGLSNFKIFNYHFNEGCLDGSFFAVYVKSGQRKTVRLLQSYGRPEKPLLEKGAPAKLKRGVGAEIGGDERRQSRQQAGEHLGASYGQKMVSSAYCYSLPPAVELQYVDEELPFELSVTGFSPLIPHDYENSNLPLAIFVFHLRNQTEDTLETSIAFSFQNNIGWSDSNSYQGTFNEVFREKGLIGIALRRAGAPIPEDHRGEVAIATPEDAGKVSYLKEWDTGENGSDFFSRVSDNGVLGNLENSVPSDRPKAGAIAVKAKLVPGESRDIPFFLSWYFPKMNLRDVGATSFGTVKEGKEVHFDLGGWSQQFATLFTGAKGLVFKAFQSHAQWWNAIHDFHSRMSSSGIPAWLVSRYFHDLTYIPGFTYWINKGEDNFFLIQEGQFGNGLCSMGVDGYNWFVLMWPKLDLQEMKQLARNQWPSGESAQELALNQGSHGTVEATWFIFRTYQDYVWTLDHEFLDFMWPFVKKTIQYTLEHEYDPQTGLTKVNLEGVNSYDSWRMDGFTAYGNSQWLACLKMAEKMATIQGEHPLARQYRQLFEKAQSGFIKNLWVDTGKWAYFKLCTGNVWDADASMLEQLIGVYWADHLGFEILPQNFVKTAVDTIYNLNSMGQLGWVCGRFPDGRVPLWDRTLEAPASKMQHSGRNRGTAQWQLASLLTTQNRTEDGIRAAELIYNLESTRRDVSLWTYPYYLCYFNEDGSFGGYFPPLYPSYPRMGSWGYYIACAGLVATHEGLYIKPRVRFDRSNQKYIAHWGKADLNVTTSGIGETIVSATVDGKDWKNIDANRGVFLPAEMGRGMANRINVEIRYN